MIQLDRVSKRYPIPGGGGKDALRQVSLHLPAGELTFLTGHSGAGKSTLLKLIMMIERPTSGDIIVDPPPPPPPPPPAAEPHRQRRYSAAAAQDRHGAPEPPVAV